jgi:hypothetical protein
MDRELGIGNLIFGIPREDNILASQWRRIKGEMDRNACLETLPGGLGSGPRALRRGADRRGLVARVARLAAGAPSLASEASEVASCGSLGMARLAGRSAFYR